MKLTIENIGMIRHADIRLDGLTIIAGENDTGKSTVGKLIFSLVKAFNRYEQDLKESKSDRILEIIEKIYFRLRRNYDFKEIKEIQELFTPPRFLMELKKYPENINEVIAKRINVLQDIKDDLGVFDLKAIKKTYVENEDKEEVIKRALKKALFSEFYSELTPKNSEPAFDSRIHVMEGKNLICVVHIRDDKIQHTFKVDELFFNEVTYIETPIHLQMNELISSASTLFEMDGIKNRLTSPTVALHIKDLISKMQNSQYYVPDDNSEKLLNEISRITKGKGFSFEKEERDFYFNKNENTKFKSINTATGLKSFGIIQLLIQANILNERSLLIIDEPEIHLHPKWQVEYAKLIVALVKNDIPVLLTSHSPEIIHALTVFSEQFGIQDRTAYYLTESDGTTSDINDVTNEINKIFIKLTEPLHNLLSGI